MGRPSDEEIAKLQQDLIHTVLTVVTSSKADSVTISGWLTRAFRFYNDAKMAYYKPVNSAEAFKRSRRTTDRIMLKLKVTNPEKNRSPDEQLQIKRIRKDLFELILQVTGPTTINNVTVDPEINLPASLTAALRDYHRLVTTVDRYGEAYKKAIASRDKAKKEAKKF